MIPLINDSSTDLAQGAAQYPFTIARAWCPTYACGDESAESSWKWRRGAAVRRSDDLTAHLNFQKPLTSCPAHAGDLAPSLVMHDVVTKSLMPGCLTLDSWLYRFLLSLPVGGDDSFQRLGFESEAHNSKVGPIWVWDLATVSLATSLSDSRSYR